MLYSLGLGGLLCTFLPCELVGQWYAQLAQQSVR